MAQQAHVFAYSHLGAFAEGGVPRHRPRREQRKDPAVEPRVLLRSSVLMSLLLERLSRVAQVLIPLPPPPCGCTPLMLRSPSWVSGQVLLPLPL